MIFVSASTSLIKWSIGGVPVVRFCWNLVSLFLTSRASFWLVLIVVWSSGLVGISVRTDLTFLVLFFTFYSILISYCSWLLLVGVWTFLDWFRVLFPSIINKRNKGGLLKRSRGFYPSHRKGFPRIICVCWLWFISRLLLIIFTVILLSTIWYYWLINIGELIGLIC